MPLRLPRPGPRDLVVAGAALCSAAIVLLVLLALALPGIDVPLRAQDGALQARDTHGQWHDITALRDRHGRDWPMPHTLAVEEPDFLDSWQDYDELLAAQAPRIAALAEGDAKLLLHNAASLSVTLHQRTLADLAWTFWLQLAYGLIALTIGLGVWAFRPRTLDTGLLLVTAIGFAVGTWSASLYSTRDLLMPADLFRLAGLLNHGGALLFDCALVALLWHYPRPLGKWPVPLLCALLWVVLWTLDAQQAVARFADGFYLWLLLTFCLAMAFALLQWRRAQGDPVARAALQWLLLSFMVGTGGFVALQVVPRVLGIEVPIPQSVLSGTFLLVYLGLAAGISRYQLFHLERWWRVTWSWLLGGVLVLVVDAALLWWLHLDVQTTLALALALAGWLYFPLRQWLLGRLLRLDAATASLNPATVRALFDHSTQGALAERWPSLLADVFRPMELEIREGNTPVSVAEQGLHLLVPALTPDALIRLSGCDRGTRLFRTADLRVAEDLLSIALHAQQAVAARAQGAQRERVRIRRDLHDDLGARLLSILHGRQVNEMQEAARQAIDDMRQMLATLDDQPVPLANAVTLIAGEAAERCQRGGLAYHERLAELPAVTLSPRQFANLKRIVREGITNTLKHAGATRIILELLVQKDTLLLRLSDDGCFDEARLEGAGRGHHIVRSRISELGGDAQWQHNAEGGCSLRVTIPLQMPAGDQA